MYYHCIKYVVMHLCSFDVVCIFCILHLSSSPFSLREYALTFNICHCDVLMGCSYRLRTRKEYLIVVEQCIPENILRQYTELYVKPEALKA